MYLTVEWLSTRVVPEWWSHINSLPVAFSYRQLCPLAHASRYHHQLVDHLQKTKDGITLIVNQNFATDSDLVEPIV